MLSEQLQNHLAALRGDVQAGGYVVIDGYPFKATENFNVYQESDKYRAKCNEVGVSPIILREQEGSFADWLFNGQKKVEIPEDGYPVEHLGRDYVTYPACPPMTDILKIILIIASAVGDEHMFEVCNKDVYHYALARHVAAKIPYDSKLSPLANIKAYTAMVENATQQVIEGLRLQQIIENITLFGDITVGQLPHFDEVVKVHKPQTLL
jgi:hypothetical protein